MFTPSDHLRPVRFVRSLAGVLTSGALVLAVSGCGGDSSQQEVGQDFVAQANSICAEFDQFSSGREKLFQEQVAGGEFGRAADTFEEYGEELRSSITELSELERPASGRESIDTFLESSRELSDLVPGVVDALRESDTATLISFATRLQELQKRADRAAREAGLEDCADVAPGSGTTN